MEQKIDRILLILDSNNKEQNTSSSLLGLLPFGINDFIMLNESLKTNKTLKEQIKQLILSCHGKDCKAFVANSLRRLITDDVAICYSLTGKNKTGQLKESFEKTEVFKMIRERRGWLNQWEMCDMFFFSFYSYNFIKFCIQ
nr:uncharacterized protein LOC107453712 isoform X2 [Parasteatoda tepidariorum]